MLECKYGTTGTGWNGRGRINRYMLGCKWSGIILKSPVCRELIDTCWDLNVHWIMGAVIEHSELIDTCWDVNIKKGHSLDYTL